jgi:hypothetical protein
MLNRWKTLTMAAVLPKTCEIAAALGSSLFWVEWVE